MRVSAPVFCYTLGSSAPDPAIGPAGASRRRQTNQKNIGGRVTTLILRGLGSGLGGSRFGVVVVEVISRFAFDRSRGNPTLRRLSEGIVRSDYDAVIAEFIRTKGITRCPTACVSPTQGSIDAADQAALEKHAVAQERLRQTKAAARARLFWNVTFPPPRER